LKVNVDKTIAASVLLHVLVIGWMMLSFSTKAFVMPEEDVVAVDVSEDNLSHVTAGMKSGKKENPKPSER
jgi:colicin import membrane protein